MKRKRIIIGTVLFVLVAAVLSLVNATKKVDVGGVLKIITDKADLYVRDFHYSEVGDPESTWEIEADSAKYIKKEKMAFLENVTVKLIMKDGAIYRMTGEEGQFDIDTKNIDVHGNVVIVSENGDQFRTEYLKYSDSEKRIFTESRVVMENPRITISGVGLSVFLTTKRMTLLSDVRARINDFNLRP